MQWGVMFFLILVVFLVLAILALVLVVIVRPVVTEAMRSRAAGTWWLPFVPRADGSYGPLTDNHWWSAFRAEQPGSGLALVVRWGFWSVMSVLLAWIVVYVVVGGAQLLGRAWI